MKKLYDLFCRFEEFVTNMMLAGITALVLASAIGRTLGYPLNWAVDISLLLFAWEVFLGGDIAVRTTNLINVDMIFSRLPKKIQKYLNLGFYVLIILFLGVLVIYGIPLVLKSGKRLFQTLPFSYGWCTLSVPAGAFLMIISCCIRMNRILHPASAAEEEKVEAKL